HDGRQEMALGAPGENGAPGPRGMVYVATIDRDTVGISPTWPRVLPGDSSDFGRELRHLRQGPDGLGYVTITADALDPDWEDLSAAEGPALYIYPLSLFKGLAVD